MLKKKFLRSAATFPVIIICISFLSACKSDAPCPDPLGCLRINSGIEVSIALAGPFTGPNRNLSDSILAGLQLSIGQQYGSEDQRIKIIKEDLNCISADWSESASRLTNLDSLTGVVLVPCTQLDPVFFQDISNAGILMIVLWLDGSPISRAPLPGEVPVSFSENLLRLDEQIYQATPQYPIPGLAKVGFDSGRLIVETMLDVNLGQYPLAWNIPRQELSPAILSREDWDGAAGRWKCKPELGCLVEVK